MKIVLATKNRDKIKEIKRIMKGVKFAFINNLPEIKEDGATLRENAVHKAETTANLTGEISLADDSGLEVEALGGMPGVKSARFAGEKVSYKENNEKLLKSMRTIRKRQAKFRCVMALAFPKFSKPPKRDSLNFFFPGRTIVREGVCRGRISEKPCGKHGFGYDPVFIPHLSNAEKKEAGFASTVQNKTFAELPPSVKNSISHRAKALKKIYKLITN